MSQQLVLDNNSLEETKQFARILYIVHAVIFLCSFGALSIIPLIVNYVKRPYTEGTLVYSHHTWMIRSFWFYVVWMAVGWLVLFTLGLVLIGFPMAWAIWGVAWLWYAYRVIRGFVDLNNNRPMPV